MYLLENLHMFRTSPDQFHDSSRQANVLETGLRSFFTSQSFHVVGSSWVDVHTTSPHQHFPLYCGRSEHIIKHNAKPSAVVCGVIHIYFSCLLFCTPVPLHIKASRAFRGLWLSMFGIWNVFLYVNESVHA